MNIQTNNIPRPLLTKQDLLILKLMSEGLANKQIAEELFISPLTIKTHLKNIYKKLDANNKIQALNNWERRA